MSPQMVNFTEQDSFYALNLHVYPVRIEMNGMQQILILHVCSTDKSE